MTKLKLVDMILSKHRSTSDEDSEQERHCGEPDLLIKRLRADINELKENISIKDTG